MTKLNRRQLHAKSLLRLLSKMTQSELESQPREALGEFVWLISAAVEKQPELMRNLRPELLRILEEAEYWEGEFEELRTHV